MEGTQSPKLKSIREAVEDGTLIDVTEVAQSVYVRCPTFVSSALWNGALERSDEKLHDALIRVSCMYDSVFGYDHIGPAHMGFITSTLEICDELGLVMLVTDSQAQNTLRIKRVGGDYTEFFA